MRPPFVYLASRSPRRRQLLRQLQVGYRGVDVAVDESPRGDECDQDYVQRLARDKANAGLAALAGRRLRGPVLGADTSIGLDHHILGKPRDRAEALLMLERLSGRAHQVSTGIALADDRQVRVAVSVSTVWFRATTAAERLAYVDSGEPMDKAGAYAIQGRAAVFIERIEGSYSGIMGLPLFETARLLAAFGQRVMDTGS